MTATNISLATNDDKKLTLNRKYKTTPDYTIPTNIKVGVNQATPTITSTALTLTVPILNGTVCDDGDNLFTGSSGGDNSTDNTTTYKQGGNQTDNTAQNLIKNATNATAIWTIADLASAGVNADATKYIGLWLYIKDATALAKFASTGTALEVRLGADTTTNYYSKTYTASQLNVGWNWLSDGLILSTWTVAGTPGTLNDLAIRITTNNATDTFVAGDVVFDLLRQWELADTLKALNSITLDESNFEASMEATINAGYASGFLLDGAAVFNVDATPLCLDIAKHEASSKSDTDIFIYTIVDRLL